jgi:putative FmdB family regulatory protein
LPLYDYKCRACSKVTEVRHGFREPYAGTCPDCGGELARVFNPAGIVFKGSGFYLTDSRKAASTEASGSSSGDKSSSDKTSSEKSASGDKAAASTPAAGSSSGDSAPKKSESSAA